MNRSLNVWGLKDLFEKKRLHHPVFTWSSMDLYGDSFLNFGVKYTTIDSIPVYELYRINPVKDGLQDSFYYDCVTLQRIYEPYKPYKG